MNTRDCTTEILVERDDRAVAATKTSLSKGEPQVRTRRGVQFGAAALWAPLNDDGTTDWPAFTRFLLSVQMAALKAMLSEAGITPELEQHARNIVDILDMAGGA